MIYDVTTIKAQTKFELEKCNLNLYERWSGRVNYGVGCKVQPSLVRIPATGGIVLWARHCLDSKTAIPQPGMVEIYEYINKISAK